MEVKKNKISTLERYDNYLVIAIIFSVLSFFLILDQTKFILIGNIVIGILCYKVNFGNRGRKKIINVEII